MKSAPQNAPQNGPILIKTKTTTPTTGEVSAENLSSASAALGLKEVMREFSDFIPGASVDTRRQMTEYCARLGAEVRHRAIMTARETPDVKNKLAYLFGILRNREADGIRSGAEWDAHERERSRRNRDAPGRRATAFNISSIYGKIELLERKIVENVIGKGSLQRHCQASL